MKFTGREYELAELNALYEHKASKLAVIYGRRRVGKSTLVEQFMQNKLHLRFEGLERQQTKEQIKQFVFDLKSQLNDPLLESWQPHDWNSVFDYLTKYFQSSRKKVIFFLDEFQWLAVNRTQLVSLIKKYWDQFWSKQRVMLILCGSVSSYMVKRVINSKALYGRINWQLCLQPLGPVEVMSLLNHKRSELEVMKYILVLGGIPKYINEINPNQSFEQNINKLLFTENGALVKEYEKIFFSQFKEYKTYETIVNYLSTGPKTANEIRKKINLTSGGGMSSYLTNLEQALFIIAYTPFNKPSKSRIKKYKLSDEYLRFYYKFILPNEKLIKQNRTRDLFSQLVKPNWDLWLGFAFENYCIKNALMLADVMGFGDYVLRWGPMFQMETPRFQVDLVFERSDGVITICEIKFYSRPIGVSIIPEMERKCQAISIPRGMSIEKVLVTFNGAEKNLYETEYFNHIISAEDFF